MILTTIPRLCLLHLARSPQPRAVAARKEGRAVVVVGDAPHLSSTAAGTRIQKKCQAEHRENNGGDDNVNDEVDDDVDAGVDLIAATNKNVTITNTSTGLGKAPTSLSTLSPTTAEPKLPSNKSNSDSKDENEEYKKNELVSTKPRDSMNVSFQSTPATSLPTSTSTCTRELMLKIAEEDGREDDKGRLSSLPRIQLPSQASSNR